MTGEWRPDMVDRRLGQRRPKVGDVVGLDWRAWEVMHVRDATPTEAEEKRLAGVRRAAPHQDAALSCDAAPAPRRALEPVVLVFVAPVDVGREPVGDDSDPVGDPWPCRESVEQETAEKELAEAERELNRMPGCCPACDEPVTSRQRSITFGGPNVRNPLAEGPTFHLRLKCRHAAARYEEAWTAAEPGRRRSLLTLACKGTVVIHGDGTAECFGADGSDCPSVYARHRVMTACFAQSHGCARGCTRAGHPGTRIANYPEDPRSVWRTT